MHKRLIPRINQFMYKVFYICFDITKINDLRNLFFAVDGFNIFSFYQKDHGLKKQDASIRKFIDDILKKERIKCDGKIFLMTHPRVLGYVFNPVSFWFCTNRNNELIAVLAQVSNTFKESHNYLIYEKNGDKIDQEKFYEANKEFHVSPFMKIEGIYRFRFIFESEKIAAYINFCNDDDQLMLATYVKGNLKKFSSVNLIKSFIAIPFVTLKVIILIHFQALKLVIKRIKYIKKPHKAKNGITKTYN